MNLTRVLKVVPQGTSLLACVAGLDFMDSVRQLVLCSGVFSFCGLQIHCDSIHDNPCVHV